MYNNYSASFIHIYETIEIIMFDENSYYIFTLSVSIWDILTVRMTPTNPHLVRTTLNMDFTIFEQTIFG